MDVSLRVNGVEHSMLIDSRTTLFDALRERLHLTGDKKRCDRGQCRMILQKPPEGLVLRPVDNPGVLRDIDTRHGEIDTRQDLTP